MAMFNAFMPSESLSERSRDTGGDDRIIINWVEPQASREPGARTEVLHSMMKSLTTLTAAATVAVALTAAPTDAFAQRYYRGGGAAIGLGNLGGVAEGAGAAVSPGYRVAAPVSRWQSRPVRRSPRAR
jgi:hypothetical protein